MRFSARTTAHLLVAPFLALGTLAATPALADCLGTARTIRVDPAKASFYNGLERSLGLRDKEVILTFDDGPIPGTTTRILDALRAECTKATFFMSGRMAQAYPRIAQRAKREGHTLASHTWDHANLAKSSSESAERNIDKGIAAIREATGQRSTPFFRYPYLAKSARTDAIVRRKGLIAFGTNIDSKDYFRVSPATVRNKVMSQLRRQGKGIVLMHDIHPRTAKMLPALLDQMKAEGFRIVHMVPGRGAPVADTVLARGERSPRVNGRAPTIAAAFASTRRDKMSAERRAANAILRDKGTRRSIGAKASVAERLRARRAVRRNFRVAASGFPTDRQGVVVQLKRR